MKLKKKDKKKQQEEQPKQHSQLQSHAINKLASSGIGLFTGDIDNHYLTPPKNITTIADRQLGEHLYAYTQQKSYLRTLVAIAEVEVIQVQKDYDEVYSRMYNNAPYENVNDKKEYAKNNKLARGYRELLDKAQAVLTLSASQLEAYNDMIFTLSREITRREKSNQQENRHENVSNKKRK